MLDATRPHSIPFDRTPHAECRALIFVAGSLALVTNQRHGTPTQALPSRPPDWSAVKQWLQHTRARRSRSCT